MGRRQNSKATVKAQDHQVIDQLTQDQRAMDAFVNALARMGHGTPSLLEGTSYENTRLTRNYQLLNTLYRSHWVVARGIDIPAEDMCKNWVQLQSQVSPDYLDRFQRVERITKTKMAVLQGIKWGRLYGGAVGLILVKGHSDYLDQPLDLDTVYPGSYRGLLIFDRWSGVTPAGDLVDDLESPDFGLPKAYNITTETGRMFRVHHSRIVRFSGRPLPLWERQAEMGWGVSEVEVAYDELKKRDNAGWSMAAMLFRANIFALKMGNLAQVLAIQNPAAQVALYNTLQAQNHLMSNMGMMVLNKDDDLTSVQFGGFKGLSDVYDSFALDIAGAWQIPVTKLFGRSPSGLNSTGESDLQNYYDRIEQDQEAKGDPVLEKIYPVMAMSAWGDVPADLDWQWNPCQTVPEDKLAEIAGKKSQCVFDAYNSNLISQRTGMKELRQLQDTTGMFSNITDEDIERADDLVQPPGGEMMGGGMMPGMEHPQDEVDAAPGNDYSQHIRVAKKLVQGFRRVLGSNEAREPKMDLDEGKIIPSVDPPVEARNVDPRQHIRVARRLLQGFRRALGMTTDEDWRESDHPRDGDGKFTSGGGSSSSSSTSKATPAAGTPASQITEGTRVNAETMGEVEKRVLAGNKGVRAELRKILRSRLDKEGPDGRNTFQDWMNPGKMGSRLYKNLRDKGLSHGEAMGKIGPILKDYTNKYDEVLGIHGSMLKATPGGILPEHIQKLKIPPAWTDVEYSTNPDSPLLVRGRDSKGRLQCVYSEEFANQQAQAKFSRVRELDEKFDEVRRQNDRARKDPKTRDVADCMEVIMQMGIRPGSDQDTKAKTKAYGASTLEGRHVVEEDGRVHLRYTGKKGIALNLRVPEGDLSEMLLRRKREAGDSGRLFPGVSAESLLEHSRGFNGGGFKTKDFRTRLASDLATQKIKELPKPTTKKEYVKRVKEVAKVVSERLGNTPTVALQSYINPFVFSEWRLPE